jgi:energy-coupling factor transporter ATP-binding protein EcfA2
MVMGVVFILFEKFSQLFWKKLFEKYKYNGMGTIFYIMNTTGILALTTRPKRIDDLIGQKDLVKYLKNQLDTRLPHFFIISGPTGVGKTTLARILALSLQVDNLNPTEKDWKNYKTFDIFEINAANDNSIDFIRELIEKLKFKPGVLSKYKIVILDEAHQLTKPAQNALLTVVEETSPHVFFIFSTSESSKIIPALKRRACILTPDVLNNKDIKILVENTSKYANFNGDTNDFIECLISSDTRSSGLIVQAMERFISGQSVESSILLSQVPGINTQALCLNVSKGDWKSVCGILSSGEVDKNQIYTLRLCIMGYLKAILVKASNRSILLAKAIKIIDESSFDNLASFIASLCLACDILSPTTMTSTQVKRKINVGENVVKK